MFIVFDNETNKLVTRMSPEWQSGFEHLHAFADAGQLVCPWCKHLLWFREESERCRSYFAHRSVTDCPYSCMSDEKSEAVAQLYDWLSQQDLDEVSFAVDLQIKGWNWPADVVVEFARGNISAYWVFDRPPKNWRVLRDGTPAHVSRHVLYTLSAHKLNQSNKLLDLAAGQRGFIGKSTFNERDDQGHLYFLDTKQNAVLLYRGLYRVHEPNLYSWDQKQSHKVPWSRCRFFPRTGEIVAVDETEHQLGLV